MLSSSNVDVVRSSRRLFCGCGVGAEVAFGGNNTVKYCWITGWEGVKSFPQGCPCDHPPIDVASFEGGDDDVSLLLWHPISVEVDTTYLQQ